MRNKRQRHNTQTEEELEEIIGKQYEEINSLKKENDYLSININAVEEAHDYAIKQRDKQMAVTQEITFLLLYLDAIQNLLKDEYTTNAEVIRNAINKFKKELSSGFGDNHLIKSIDSGIITME